MNEKASTLVSEVLRIGKIGGGCWFDLFKYGFWDLQHEMVAFLQDHRDRKESRGFTLTPL